MDAKASARRAVTAASQARWKLQHQLGRRLDLDSIPEAADLHLGCGDHRLGGRVNVDVRPTSATDVVADLNRPPIRSAHSVVSHAFFEHLYRKDRLPHLRAIREGLTPDGWVLYLGLPDFQEIARLYLEGAPGIVGPRFDLYHVYRYTHGDPEHVTGWWLEQLHKSLFDQHELDGLLRDSGFGSWLIANYAFKSEPYALNLGFYARGDDNASVPLALEALREFDDQVNAETLRWSAPVHAGAVSV